MGKILTFPALIAVIYGMWCAYNDFLSFEHKRDILALKFEALMPVPVNKEMAALIRKAGNAKDLKALSANKIFTEKFIADISKQDAQAMYELAMYCLGRDDFAMYADGFFLTAAKNGSVPALKQLLKDNNAISSSMKLELLDARMKAASEFSDEEKKLYIELIKGLCAEEELAERIRLLDNLCGRYPGAFFCAEIKSLCDDLRKFIEVEKKIQALHREAAELFKQNKMQEAINLLEETVKQYKDYPGIAATHKLLSEFRTNYAEWIKREKQSIRLINRTEKTFTVAAFRFDSKKSFRKIYDAVRKVKASRLKLKELSANKNLDFIERKESEAALATDISNARKEIRSAFYDGWWYYRYSRGYWNFNGKEFTSEYKTFFAPGKYWILGFCDDRKSCFIEFVEIAKDAPEKAIYITNDKIVTFE